MTILESVLNFTGASIVSGITWDILKSGGKKIIEKFKEKFISNGSFENGEQCNEFLNAITDKEPNSKKNPFNDVINIYEDIVDSPVGNFLEDFKIWIHENMDSLMQISNCNNQKVSIIIQHQENNGSGSITNAGIINNYKG